MKKKNKIIRKEIKTEINGTMSNLIKIRKSKMLVGQVYEHGRDEPLGKNLQKKHGHKKSVTPD